MTTIKLPVTGVEIVAIHNATNPHYSFKCLDADKTPVSIPIQCPSASHANLIQSKAKEDIAELKSLCVQLANNINSDAHSAGITTETTLTFSKKGKSVYVMFDIAANIGAENIKLIFRGDHLTDPRTLIGFCNDLDVILTFL